MELVLGTAQWGLAYGIAGRGAAVDATEVRRILSAAAAAGVRRIDTAQAYGDIEQRLAALLPPGTNWRITTKIPRAPSNLDIASLRQWVSRAMETSWGHLGNRLEGVLFHDATLMLDPALGPAAWTALQAACSARGVRAGVSVYGPEEVQTLLASYAIEQVQFPANALDQRLADAGSVKASRVVRHLRSVFLQGLLLTDAAAARLPAARGPLMRWRAWCNEHTLAPTVAALAIVRGLDPGATGVVVGVDSVAQFEQVARAWSSSRPVLAPELRCDDPGVIDPRRWTIAA